MGPYWARQIVANAAIQPGELVVDLGAGNGALTLPLVEAGARVIAVELHAGRARQLRATLNGYAASVVECDLEDFAAPGRAFRLVANPPYALTAAVFSLWLGRLISAAQIWFYREPSYNAWSTRAAATYAGSTPVAVCQSQETPSCRRHLSTPLCSRSAALDGRGITRPRMPLELIVVACGAPKSRRRPSVLQKVIFGRRTSTTNTKE